MKKNYLYELSLILTTLIWGSAFVAQQSGSEYVEAFTFNGLRAFIAIFTLWIAYPFIRKKSLSISLLLDSSLCKAGAICGFFLTMAMFFQQYGIAYTSVAKAGFLSGFYVIFVPLLSIFLGNKLKVNIWIAVLLSMIGLYFLSISEVDSFAVGDTYILICAFIYALQIMSIGHYARREDPILLTLMQFVFVAIFSFILMFIFEKPALQNIQKAVPSLLYAGMFSSGVAYCLQTIAQRHIDSSIASILMSLESVFAALSGYLFLQQGMSLREIGGAILIFSAVIIANMPYGFLKKKHIDHRSK